LSSFFGLDRYAPISVRLVELANNWRQMVDVLNLLPGPNFEQEQQLPDGVLQGTSSPPLLSHAHVLSRICFCNVLVGRPSPVGGATGTNKVTLVFFIGGVTFTEIAAIRWLSQQDGALLLSRPFLSDLSLSHLPKENKDYIVATTKLVNGDTLLSTFMENIESFMPV